MKIPEQLKIGGHTFKIEYPYFFLERSDIDGHTDFCADKIFISNVNSAGIENHPDYVEQVFWHEIFHVINQVYCCNGIENSTNNGEFMMDGLAQGLLQVLKDNFKELEIKDEL